MILAGGAAAAAILAGCGGAQQDTAQRPEVPVRVQVLAPFDGAVTKTYTGALEGQNQAAIYTKIAEAVESVLVREGGRVQAGQVLVKLDRTGSMSNYQQALSVYRNAEKNYTKMKTLYGQGAVSEMQYDAARTEYEVAQASFEAARRLVEIQSPISGIVTSVNVRRGDYLAQGQMVATVAATERLRVRFQVKATDVGLVQVGDTVRVTAETAAESLPGVVAAVAQSADPASRAFEVEALVANAGESSFRPGMFVRVELVMERLQGVLGVPPSAVVALSSGAVVYVVENGLARRRPVTLGTEAGGRVIVSEGLRPGDSVIVLGQSYLDDSAAIRVTDVEKGAR